MRRDLRRVIPAVLATLLGVGCGLVPGLDDPLADPAARPGVVDEDIAPIGPVVEIGRGESAVNGPWRYTVYESRLGMCTKLEFLESGDGPMGCGGTLRLEPGAAVSLLSYGTATGSGWSIEGMADDDVTRVFIEVVGGRRIAAGPLMSLAPVGLGDQLFYAETPEGLQPIAVIGLGEGDEVLAEVPIDAP